MILHDSGLSLSICVFPVGCQAEQKEIGSYHERSVDGEAKNIMDGTFTRFCRFTCCEAKWIGYRAIVYESTIRRYQKFAPFYPQEKPGYKRSAGSGDGFAYDGAEFSGDGNNHSQFDTAMHIAQHSGVLKDLYEDKSVEGLSNIPKIFRLLMDIALLTNDDNDKNPNADTVSPDGPIHSQKDWNFRLSLSALEENLFPTAVSANSISEHEEENDSFYVAVTRAEKKLHLSYATSRYRMGSFGITVSQSSGRIESACLDLDFKPRYAYIRQAMVFRESA
ncbi:hypothetical protein FQR65_LT17347 [Abscondita terminalis]|nr:hypothetical protein FQR65_LT17347 [Abscondita terminalis]